MSAKRVAVIIPPTIGAAILRMTSEPAPPTTMMGNKPPIIANVVIIIGLSRSNAPSTIAARISSSVKSLRSSLASFCLFASA